MANLTKSRTSMIANFGFQANLLPVYYPRIGVYVAEEKAFYSFFCSRAMILGVCLQYRCNYRSVIVSLISICTRG